MSARLEHRVHRRAAVGLGLVAVAALLVSGCASSHLQSEWRDASFTNGPLRNIYVIAVKNDPLRRRIWEDSFVAALVKQGAKATASYRDFPNAMPDTAAVIAKVKEAGYDGVIVTHRVGTDERTVYVPGTTQRESVGWTRDWSGRYVESVRETTTPGYTETEKIVHHETSVWQTKQGGSVIWSGLTETPDPTSPEAFSKDILELIVPKLTKAGIL